MPIADSGKLVNFRTDFVIGPSISPKKIAKLNSLRRNLHKNGLICQNPRGIGYGNASQRVGKNKFIITKTQTGGKPRLTSNDYITIVETHPKESRVVAKGPGTEIGPSSEAITHGVIYNMDNGDGKIRFIAHVHGIIHKHSKELGIPTIKENVKYGSYDLTKSIKRLFKNNPAVRELCIFSMGKGHDGGIIAFGKTQEKINKIMTHYLKEAKKLAG